MSGKRLREGTHSCLSCRRRKVRCKFELQAHKCVQCLRRDTDCIPQQQKGTPPTHPDGDENSGVLNLSLKEVLNHLERSKPSLANVFDSTRLNTGSSELQAAKFSTPAPIQNFLPNLKDAELVPDRAPLLSLFDRPAISSYQDSYTKNGATGKNDLQIFQAVKLYMPTMNSFKAMLIQGHHTWMVWIQTFQEHLIFKPNETRDEQAITLCGLIYTSLHSGDRALVAKILLCTILQIQQLPRESSCADLVLQQNCLDSVDSLLASEEGLVGTLDGLECLLLQVEYYVNLANLRKAWLIVRRAVNLAQLLGFHLGWNDPNPKLMARRKELWMRLWQMDRGFSMILGLPCATLDTQYPAILPEMHEERFLRDLGVIMGRIVARNQNRSQMKYPETLEIDEELDDCKDLMPPSWWEPQPHNNTSFDLLFLEYSKKMRFYTARKLVHLPFMLKAYTDHKYEDSREAALIASKAIIGVFRALRDERLIMPKMCEMADFEAFCAAMTIVVDLVSRSPRDDAESDWQIISDVAEDLNRVSATVSCSVAAKGAQVLKDLYDSRHHSVSSTSSLDLDIPYFGEICIRRAPSDHSGFQQSLSRESPSEPLRSTYEVSGGASNAASFDGWFFPYVGDSQLWQNGYGSAMPTNEFNVGEDWDWFLGNGDSI